jgi:hypothetical protein
MSNLVSVLSTVHDRQFAAATKVQNTAVNAVRQMILLADQATEASTAAALRLPRVGEPLASVVDPRGELAALLRKNARQWAELQRDCHAAIIETLLKAEPSEEPVQMPPKVVKIENGEDVEQTEK